MGFSIAFRLASLFLAPCMTSVLGAMEFINPPPFGVEGDLGNSETYRQGQTVNVAWTAGEEGKGASLVLWQLNATSGTYDGDGGDGEYLTQSAVGVTRYSWLVGTRRNLTFSSLFYLSIFQEGNTSPDQNSHYFFIEDNGTDQQTPSPSPTQSQTSVSGSPTTNPADTSTPSDVPTSTPAPTTTSSTQLQEAASGLNTGAKVGIGVGIPVALVLGLFAGYLLFKRYKRKDQPYAMEHSTPPTQQGYYAMNAQTQYGTYEAGLKSPVEMEGQGQNEFPVGVNEGQRKNLGEPIRHEM